MCMVLSAHNRQPRLHQLIQQINRLLEPLILYECSICFLGCLDRSMTQQMPNVSYSSTSAQQAGSKCFSQIM